MIALKSVFRAKRRQPPTHRRDGAKSLIVDPGVNRGLAAGEDFELADRIGAFLGGHSPTPEKQRDAAIEIVRRRVTFKNQPRERGGTTDPGESAAGPPVGPPGLRGSQG